MLNSLDLVSWRSLSDHNVSTGSNNCHTVGIQQLAVSFAHLDYGLTRQFDKISYLPKLELEIAFSVEDLDAVVVGVSHYDLVVGSHRHPARLGELPSEDAKLAKLAVIDHLLTLDVRLWGIDDGW